MVSALYYKVGDVPKRDVSYLFEVVQLKFEVGLLGFWLNVLGCKLSPLGGNVKLVMIYLKVCKQNG
jgi:hypothetical protein